MVIRANKYENNIEINEKKATKYQKTANVGYFGNCHTLVLDFFLAVV